MDHSASAPSVVLTNEDYAVPCHGVGLTGHARKLQLGTFAKDKGEFSSRLGQVMKQAAKTPGPGKYDVGHTQWCVADKTGGNRKRFGNQGETVHLFGNAFSKTSREHKSLNKTPAPATYERKDVSSSSFSIAASDRLSGKERVPLGRISKGPKRSFIDSVIEVSKQQTTPGQYTTPHCVAANVFNRRVTGPSMELKISENRKGPKKDEIAPNRYNLNHGPVEDLAPKYSVPKDHGNNFVDKCVKAKMIDKKTQMPAPGKHDLIDLNKITRGTKLLSLGGLGRGSCSGYF